MAKSKGIRNAALALGAAALAYGVVKSRRSADAPQWTPAPPPVLEESHKETPAAEPQPSSRWRMRLGILAMLVGVALLIAAAVVTWWPKDSSVPSAASSSNPNVAVPIQLKDKSGQTITLDTKVAPAILKKMHAVSQIGTSFVKIPAINFDTPLGAVDEVDGQLTPPGIYSVYWVRNLGVSVQNASQGTVFLIIHSVHGGALVPGNQLINVDQGTSAVPLGAEIAVDTQHYQVTRTDVISRDVLPTRGDVWNNVPGQLVLITCLERPDGSEAVNNVVVWARRV